jgi:hypothetical protein
MGCSLVKAYLDTAPPGQAFSAAVIKIDKSSRPALSSIHGNGPDLETDWPGMKDRAMAVTGAPRLAAKLVTVLLCVGLILSLGAMPHHHADGLNHADCPYCAFPSLPVLSAAPCDSPAFSLRTTHVPPNLKASVIPSLYGSLAPIRAPPT